MSEILNKVNWVDIFVLILLIRISYISSRVGVGKQILPLILLVIILSLALKYYSEFADFFVGRFGLPSSACNFFSYFCIVTVFGVIYYVISRVTGFFLSIGEDAVGNIEKIGGLVIGFFRSVLIIGIILTGFLLLPVKFFESGVRNSFSGAFFINVNLKIYATTANLIFRRGNISSEKIRSQLLKEKDMYLFESSAPKKKSRFFRESY